MFFPLVATLLLCLTFIAVATCDPYLHPTLALDLHNSFRAQHGASPLSWNPALAAPAREHSAKCIWGHATQNGPEFGENLAIGFNHPDAAILAWVNERDVYDYESGGSRGGAVGHFTQMVWKGSESVGCAAVRCDGVIGKPPGMVAWYLTCRYWPPGNWVGNHRENVMRRVG